MSACYTVNRLGYYLLLFGCFWLFSCSSSSRQTPAPVVSLDMSEPRSSTPFDNDIYTIQTGDTLFAIAWYSGNDYRDLARWNNISPPYTIRAGQRIDLKPPTIVASAISKTSSLVKSNPVSGQTRSKSEHAVIDRPPEQAYGASEKNVSRQQLRDNPEVKAVVASSETPRQFSQTIKRWVWPAAGDIVGTFDKAESGNKGIDIRNKLGTQVVAAADGKVVYTGEALRGYGRLMIIKHTETYLSAYAHNDRILVEEQQWVKAGEKIGTMGSSGTDAVKLHFEVRYRGRSLDPQRYLPRQ